MIRKLAIVATLAVGGLIASNSGNAGAFCADDDLVCLHRLNHAAILQSNPPGQRALSSAQQIWCPTVFEYGIGMRRFCGSFAELERATLVCHARYEALSDRERSDFIGINLTSHCDALQRAKDSIVWSAGAREKERQRIDDAHRQLRALGVEQ